MPLTSTIGICRPAFPTFDPASQDHGRFERSSKFMSQSLHVFPPSLISSRCFASSIPRVSGFAFSTVLSPFLFYLCLSTLSRKFLSSSHCSLRQVVYWQKCAHSNQKNTSFVSTACGLVSFTYRGNLVVSPLGSPPGPLFASCAYVLFARAVRLIGLRTVDRAVEATMVGVRRVIACIFVCSAFMIRLR